MDTTELTESDFLTAVVVVVNVLSVTIGVLLATATTGGACTGGTSTKVALLTLLLDTGGGGGVVADANVISCCGEVGR